MSRFRNAGLGAASSLFLGLALPVLLGAACAQPASEPPAAAEEDDSPVVATVDGEDITLKQLDDWIKDQLFEQQVAKQAPSKQFEVRSGALQGLIQDRVIRSRAERMGVEPDDLIRQRAAELGPVTDDEVAAFFEEHKARFRPPQNTLESRSDQIRSYLASQRMVQAASAIRDEADVTVDFDPPRVEVAASGPSRGPEDASVTIVEFSDFQCPYCSRALPTIQAVLDRYPEDVRVVYRHFPLESIHPRARPAAVAAVCAEEQDKFWEYHDLLFENARALSDENLAEYASQLGLDEESFTSCLERDDVAARVQRDIDAARAAGVSGTPAFFVNGILMAGARSPEDFAELIDSELARLEPAS